MSSKGLILSFTELPMANRTMIASLTAQELKRRGYNIETPDGQSTATDWISVLENSKGDEDSTQTLKVQIGIPGHEEDDESRNAVENQHLNLTKIVVQPDALPEQCVADILSKLEALELIARPAPENSSYDEEDEATIRSRLEALGYL